MATVGVDGSRLTAQLGWHGPWMGVVSVNQMNGVDFQLSCDGSPVMTARAR